MQALHTVLYTSPKEDLWNSREHREFSCTIVPFILMTLMFDSGVILSGEMKCLSL